jgi:hypothetical protein
MPALFISTSSPPRLPASLVEHAVDLRHVGDVANRCRDRRFCCAQACERLRVDVAHVHSRTGLDEGVDDRAADAGGARSHQRAFALQRQLHSGSP